MMYKKLFLFVLGLLVLTLLPKAVIMAESTTLFTPYRGQIADPYTPIEPTLTTTYMTLNQQVFVGGEAETINFNLPNGEIVLLRAISVQTSAESVVWQGTAESIPGSWVTLDLQAGQLRGTANFHDQFLKIRPVLDNVHAIDSLDLTVFLESDVDAIPVTLDDAYQDPPSAPQDAGTPVVDVIVLWTPAALAAYQSANPGRDGYDMANQAVEVSNQAYLNGSAVGVSGQTVNHRQRLVYAGELATTMDNPPVGSSRTPYLCAISPTNLSSTCRTTWSAYEGIHNAEVSALAAQYGADLVGLLVNHNGCGVAWRPTSTGSMTSRLGYNVTHWSCVAPNWSYTHEVGHNFGMNHAHEDTGSFAFVADAFGYKNQTAPTRFRTLMSYNCSTGCTRLQYVSNEQVSDPFNGLPMGSSTSGSEADTQEAYNISAPFIADNRTNAYDIAIGSTYHPVVSATVFNDFAEWDDGNGNENCVTDVDGANDVAGDNDITRFCSATNGVDMLYLLQSFDETNPSTSAVGCTLFDNDDNDNAEYALCTTIASTGLVSNVRLYSCNDSQTDGCGSAAAVKTYGTEPSLSGAYYPDGTYFAKNTEIGGFNVDAQVEIMLPFTDLGVNGIDDLDAAFYSFDSTSSADLLSPQDSLTGTPLAVGLAVNQTNIASLTSLLTLFALVISIMTISLYRRHAS